MAILNEILQAKQKEVAVLKRQPPKENGTVLKRVPKIADTFAASSTMNIIAEIKRASPSKGAINLALDPVSQAKQYEANGACAISVLTDQTFFKGSMADLRAIRSAVGLPILCKDFIIDPVQIDHAKANGATIILLIAAALTASQFADLYQYAVARNLEVLCEVHNLEELKLVQKLHPPIIGINNRDLNDFHVDLKTTGKIIPFIKNETRVIISESGIQTAENAKTAADYGANTLLVGEAFVRAKNLTKTFQDFRISIKKETSSHAR